MKIVLVTGSAGRVGQAAVQSLIRAGWHVRGYDRVPSPGAHESFVGDLADAAGLRRAAHAANAVIHLAATPDDEIDDEGPEDCCCRLNPGECPVHEA